MLLLAQEQQVHVIARREGSGSKAYKYILVVALLTSLPLPGGGRHYKKNENSTWENVNDHLKEIE